MQALLDMLPRSQAEVPFAEDSSLPEGKPQDHKDHRAPGQGKVLVQRERNRDRTFAAHSILSECHLGSTHPAAMARDPFDSRQAPEGRVRCQT